MRKDDSNLLGVGPRNCSAVSSTSAPPADCFEQGVGYNYGEYLGTVHKICVLIFCLNPLLLWQFVKQFFSDKFVSCIYLKGGNKKR